MREVLLEFAVEGPAVSGQARRQRLVREWKGRVSKVAREADSSGLIPYRGSVRVEIGHYYDQWRVDLDNLAMPILDALQEVAYERDRQVDSLTVYRQPIRASYRLIYPSLTLLTALNSFSDFVHVIVEALDASR